MLFLVHFSLFQKPKSFNLSFHVPLTNPFWQVEKKSLSNILFFQNVLLETHQKTHLSSLLGLIESNHLEVNFRKTKVFFIFCNFSNTRFTYNPSMLGPIFYFWNKTTNTLKLPYGMISPTLFELAAIAGLLTYRESYPL